jgi:hypothetical protein
VGVDVRRVKLANKSCSPSLCDETVCRMLDRNHITGTLPRKWSALVKLQKLCAPAPKAPITYQSCNVLTSQVCVRVCAALHVAVFTGTSTKRPVTPVTLLDSQFEFDVV